MRKAYKAGRVTGGHIEPDSDDEETITRPNALLVSCTFSEQHFTLLPVLRILNIPMLVKAFCPPLCSARNLNANSVILGNRKRPRLVS